MYLIVEINSYPHYLFTIQLSINMKKCFKQINETTENIEKTSSLRANKQQKRMLKTRQNNGMACV